MKPCVLIATHKRLDITKVTVDLLLQQTDAKEVVIVCSDGREHRMFKELFPEVHVVRTSNDPLGKKWQYGVEVARRLDINSLIIQGSDDVLHKDFVSSVSISIKLGVDFVGLRQWWIYDPVKQHLYLFDYTPVDFPLGGGRYYSRRLLDKIDWKIFDTKKSRHLDDYGWHEAKRHRNYCLLKDTVSTGLQILSIKGLWPVMNKLDDIMHHVNARLLSVYTGDDAKRILKNNFGYEP